MALKLPRGGILYGPPGTGKTLMARTIAHCFFDEENVTIINGPALISKYVGQSAENLRNILETARANPDVTHVVIIDEIDALVCARNSSDEGIINKIKADLTATILTYLDGVDVINNLMILGLTNYIDRLDDALIRPGRLGVHIKIDLPNVEDRLAILKLYLSDLQKKNIVSDKLNIDLLAEKSKGLSGAGIKAFIDTTVEKFSLSQIVSFEKGSLKIGNSNKLVPLDETQFLICLESALLANKQKKSEHEILLSRPFYEYNQSLYLQSLTLRKMAQTFAYFSPMLINITGVTGAGATSFSLNLFKEAPNQLVYMKAGELVNLPAKEQQKYIENCFSQALLKGNGVLIIDDLEDIRSCIFNPIIHLRNKLKMSLEEGETLKIILISKKEDTINALFNDQITCDAAIKLPLITQKHELFTFIQSLGLEMDLNDSSVEMEVKLPIGKLKTALLTYCNKTKPEVRNFDNCINYLNALYSDNKENYNSNRIFKPATKSELPDTPKGTTKMFQLNS